MYLTILGSGAGGSPGSKRWRAANLITTDDTILLVDCGVGCHYRLSDRGLLTEVDYVFITHSHMDHFLGLPEMLFQAHIEDRRKPIYIFAPKIVEDTLKAAAPHTLRGLRYEVHLRRISEGALLEGRSFRVVSTKACHHTAEEAYAFKVSADIDIVFTGDTSPGCETIERLAQGADVLVHEATCNEQYMDICVRYGHTTTLQAIDVARRVGSNTLILTHIDEKFNPTVYLEVKNSGYPAVVAEDNMVIKL